MEEPWPRGRMPDSGAREPGFESSTYDGAVDGDTLWRQQNKILVIVLGNKLNIAHNLFFNRVVSAWNGLPQHIVNLESSLSFKKALRTVSFHSLTTFDRHM